MEIFSNHPGFCPVCGSIFPLLSVRGNTTCYNCKEEFGPEAYGSQEVEYTIHFNTYNAEKFNEKIKKEENEPDGPIIDRKCSKCGHEKMSYATVQLRSADEGQTVFFTCLLCKFKESENS